MPAAGEVGVDLFGAGAHPFAAWSQQHLTPGHRYEELINRTQWWGRQMLIWGVHVHVGMPAVERVMPVLSSLLNTFPHLQALSASSPVWAGTDTGYASNRALMFQQLPTAGLPFQFDTWAEYEGFCEDSVTTGVIEDLADVRWDIRPSAHNGTIENRVCDGVSTVDELAALVALMHCLCVDLDARLAAGERLPTPAALARPGEQVARRALRPRRRDHHRRGLPRAARDRRPRRPADPARAGRGPARLLRRAAGRRRHPAARGVLPAAARGRRRSDGDLTAVVASVVDELYASLDSAEARQ